MKMDSKIIELFQLVISGIKYDESLYECKVIEKYKGNRTNDVDCVAIEGDDPEIIVINMLYELYDSVYKYGYSAKQLKKVMKVIFSYKLDKCNSKVIIYWPNIKLINKDEEK